MNAPLSQSYWEAVRQLAQPFELMKFTLIYDGPLPAGAKKRSVFAAKIRNVLHPQMRDLWDHHVIMRQLTHTARTYLEGGFFGSGKFSPTELPNWDGPPRPLMDGQTDLVAPIAVPNVGNFIPIIRNSLYLACAIDLLFLRHEEPMHLFDSGGDIDNRLKCFFDALTIPNAEQASTGEDPCADPLCCLLENDKLISDFSVRSGRLLGKSATEKDRFDVRIQADITVKVLRVREQNQCLIGG